MNMLIRLQLLLTLMLGLASLSQAAEPKIGYFEAVASSEAPVVGKEYYTRHTLMYERGVHLSTNYWRGVLVPINSKVTLLQVSSKELKFLLNETKETITVENVVNFSRRDIHEIAKRMFSSTPVSLDAFSPEMASSIKSGITKKGMTKEQVVMARGYPPGHKTPSLDGDRWQYWSSRFVIQTLVFQDGVLVDGRGT